MSKQMPWRGGVSREERAQRTEALREAAKDAPERKAAKDRWSWYVERFLTPQGDGSYRHRD